MDDKLNLWVFVVVCTLCAIYNVCGIYVLVGIKGKYVYSETLYNPTSDSL